MVELNATSPFQDTATQYRYSRAVIIRVAIFALDVTDQNLKTILLLNVYPQMINYLLAKQLQAARFSPLSLINALNATLATFHQVEPVFPNAQIMSLFI